MRSHNPWWFVLLLVTGLCVNGSCYGGESLPLENDPNDAEIKAFLKRFIDRDHWGVGMVVGIVDEHGTRIISHGKLTHGNSPEVTGDTLFEIGSITKTFTTLLLQDMIARGEMGVDDPVEKFLPTSYIRANDPAFGVSKRLRVQFRLGHEMKMVEANENETVNLPREGEVKKASYGDPNHPERTVDVTPSIVALLKDGKSRIRVDNWLTLREVPLKVPTWRGRKITLRDLATHRSGLPRDLYDNSVNGLYDMLSQCRLPREPGHKAEYCNVGLQLLGRAIELKSGTNFETLLLERICRPLGMESTCIVPSATLRSKLATSHGQENRPCGRDGADVLAPLPGSGAIRSTANDMLKFLAANLGLQPSPLNSLMRKTHVIQVPHAFEDADLALPWWVYRFEGSTQITHGGSTMGHNAFAGFDTTLKRGVVVLANREDSMGQAVQPFGLYLLHPPAKRPVPANVSKDTLDQYVGIYEFPKLPQGLMTVRREDDQLILQFINSVAGNGLVPLSETVFADSLGGESRVRMGRSLLRCGRRSATFTRPQGRTWRAYKVADQVPLSLFEPMLQPLPEGACPSGPRSDLQGTWNAVARLWYWPFASQKGTLKIVESSPGRFQAEFDFPQVDVKKLPVSVIYDTPAVELIARSGAGMFVGKINSEHTKMSGHYIIGARRARATLVKAKP